MTSELPSDYQAFIHQSRYARWLESEGRRETWTETVDRYMVYLDSHLANKHEYDMGSTLYKQLQDAIYNLEVMPSMRSLMTAGPALERENIAGFNCAYVAVDHPRVFDEVLYILLCGTGVGYSVERQFCSKLPSIPQLDNVGPCIVVEDSKRGWASAFKQLLRCLWSGEKPTWDTSKVRPKGSRLKTFGGRASGPEPLERLFSFVVSMFQSAAGRNFNALECHDIMCSIADTVIVGGVRRSAMISLSNLSDGRMRDAKSGEWWHDNPNRSYANNSVAYTEKPDIGIFMKEWLSLYESKSGERGIFNRNAAKICSPGRRDTTHEFGTNPCSEIVLRSMQFCNLTEVVVREDDSIDEIKRKVYLASILGTFQSTLTNFKHLRKGWTDNTNEERLLGVSLTGIMDSRLTSKLDWTLGITLRDLKNEAVKTNASMASKIGIPRATAVTCVKPSGTVSQLVNSSSGIHARHSDYYIRSVRGDKKDPLTSFMIDKGVPHEDDVMNPSNVVFYFSMKSPKGAITRNDKTALEQLELWKTYQLNWCEHKPSVTISVREHEWLEVGSWVYANFDIISGVSFLPYSDHVYQQPPYEECTKEKYDQMVLKLPKGIDWSELSAYEVGDTTVSSSTLACTGGVCELVDIEGEGR